MAAALLLLAGCASAADRYGKDEIISYARTVHGSGTVFVREKTARYNGGIRSNQYIFRDSAGRKFSVWSEPVESAQDGEPSGTVHKGISDNYYDAVITDRADKLQALIDDSGLDVRLVQTGSTDKSDGRTWKIEMYLDRTDDFGDASMLISKMDALLAYRCERSSSSIGHGLADSKSIVIYMEPDQRAQGDTAEDWKESPYLSNYRISSVKFTNGGDRLTASQADSEMENDFVDTVKLQKLRDVSCYDIPDTLSSKYNAPVLYVTSVQGHRPKEGEYTFYYDRDSGQYWMTNLDLCQDFDGFPYEYSTKGSFAQLVRWLGGEYSCSDWQAQWSLGNYSWTARLSVKKSASSPYTFRSMQIERGDTFLTLSQPASDIPGEGTNGTPSGRAYSIEDLVRMLHADITVNEDKMTAMIYS